MSKHKHQGSILLMTLLMLAVVMAIIGGMALATRARIHAAHQRSEWQQIVSDDSDGFFWAIQQVLHVTDSTQWPLSHRMQHEGGQTHVWVQPLGNRLNVNAWLQAGPLPEALLHSWPFVGGDAKALALRHAILAKRQRMDLDHWSKPSTLHVQSQRWLDWRAVISRKQWLALQAVMTAYPQKKAGVALDPRLIDEPFLRTLGVSEGALQSWARCLIHSKKADSFTRAKGCASELSRLTSLTPSWEKTSVYVITVVTVSGKRHHSVQWCVRMSRHGKAWQWAVLWRHVGLAQFLSQEST